MMIVIIVTKEAGRRLALVRAQPRKTDMHVDEQGSSSWCADKTCKYIII